MVADTCVCRLVVNAPALKPATMPAASSTLVVLMVLSSYFYFRAVLPIQQGYEAIVVVGAALLAISQIRYWPASPEPQLEWAVVAADRLEHQSIQGVQKRAICSPVVSGNINGASMA